MLVYLEITTEIYLSIYQGVTLAPPPLANKNISGRKKTNSEKIPYDVSICLHYILCMYYVQYKTELSFRLLYPPRLK